MAPRQPKKPSAKPTDPAQRDTRKHARKPRARPKADPSDPAQVGAAHRRAVALAAYYTRLAEVLVPASPVPPAITPAAARILASLPGGRRAMMAARAAEVAASLASTAGERRATIDKINSDWARHRGREDVALLAEHDVIAAVVEAAADADAEGDVLDALRLRWPDVVIDAEIFGEAAAAWRNSFKRGPAVAHLLHRAGLRPDTAAARAAVQRVLERFDPEHPGW